MMEVSIIKDKFSVTILTNLEKFVKNPQEKTKLMKCSFTEENIHTFVFIAGYID